MVYEDILPKLGQGRQCDQALVGFDGKQTI